MTSLTAVDTTSRHSRVVRLTHWTATLCFFALLITGLEIIVSHPRFYWGEEGNSLTASLFDIPIPASRSGVVTGYNYVLPDQNGWSRSLHFQAAWLLVFAGGLYGVYGLLQGHFHKNLVPSRAQLSWPTIRDSVAAHLRMGRDGLGDSGSYNVLQRMSYLGVVFGLLPAMIWTGLAMSPGFTAAFPLFVDLLGGFQSARTIHFFVTLALAIFVVAHVVMVWLGGFRKKMRAMTMGGPEL